MPSRVEKQREAQRRCNGQSAFSAAEIKMLRPGESPIFTTGFGYRRTNLVGPFRDE